MNKSAKTTLVFFGDLENSRYGVYRALLATVFLFIFLILLHPIHTVSWAECMKRKWGMLISWFSLVSALCVVVPSGTYDAFKYGACVGFVVMSIAMSVVSGMFDSKSVGFTCLAVVLCGIISTLVYLISHKLNLYPLFTTCSNVSPLVS